MNGSKFLLDTNIVIPILNLEASLLERVQGLTIFVPSIVLGELYYGARHSGKISENLAKIEVFRTRSAIIPCNAITADHYGRIKQQLHEKGRPIPENDLWIASIAIQHDLTLVSRDSHFDQIDQLKTESW